MNVVLPPRHGLSLCSGGGGLDLGVELAFPSFTTSCYVEIDEYPRSTLIAGQQAGYLKPAPIWDDLKQFNGRPFRGIVDCLTAGYPCQPFSQAGQRKGAADPRHLWPDIARIADEVRPPWIILENVAGHVSLGAETVLRDLRGMGFVPAAGLFTAAETGATHERKRWFCLAYSDGNAQQFANSRHRNTGSGGRNHVGGGSGKAVANTCGGRSCGSGQGQDQQPWGAEIISTIPELVNTAVDGCDEGQPKPSIRGRWGSVAGTGCGMAQPASSKRDGTKLRAEWRGGPSNSRRNVADTIGNAGHQGRHRKGGREGREGQATGFGTHRPNIHPPGPSDIAAWASIIAMASDLAPAVSFGDSKRFADHLAQMVAAGELAQEAAQSAICRMVDGLAQRSRALKLLGNGVFPLEAAYAIRTLGYAHGLCPMDMGADG